MAKQRILICGDRGMVGSALVRRLRGPAVEIIGANRAVVDLTRQAAVEEFIVDCRPDVIIVAAAKVGGIHANSHQPVPFLYDNLAIETHIIQAAHQADVDRLLFLGSSCMYPRAAAQPIVESALLSGPLEPTNQWYALVKIAGVMLCQAYRAQYGRRYISAIPTNLFGPGDNFHPENSHVPAALMRRFEAARRAGAASVAVWGSGRPRREFLHVDDLADACAFLLDHYDAAAPTNVGRGSDITIADFAAMMAETVGFAGTIAFDPARPDGMPRRVLDVGALTALGWRARIPLAAGLADTYAWFQENRAGLRA